MLTGSENRAGNLRQLMREQVGSYDVKWQEIYGMVARIHAPLCVRHFFCTWGDAVALIGSRTGREVVDI